MLQHRDPVTQHRDRIKRLFQFGPSKAPRVDLARIGDEWTAVGNIVGIVGRDCPLPADSELADDLSVTLFEWEGVFPVHVHEQQETIHVLFGTIEVVLEGRRHIVREGEAITIAAMIEHSGRTLRRSLIACAYLPPLPYAT